MGSRKVLRGGIIERGKKKLSSVIGIRIGPSLLPMSVREKRIVLVREATDRGNLIKGKRDVSKERKDTRANLKRWGEKGVCKSILRKRWGFI